MTTSYISRGCIHARLKVIIIFAVCLSGLSWVCWAQEVPKEITAGEFRSRLNLSQDPEPVLKRILESEEFKKAETRSFFQRIRDLTLDWIESILNRLFRKIPKLNVTAEELEAFWQILVGMLFAVVLGVLAFVFFRNRGFIFGKTGRAPLPEPLFEEKYLTSDAARLNARRFADQGNFAQALIHLFRATLLWLDEHGKLAFYTGKTNREILAGIDGNEPAAAVLGQMIPVFDRIRYGNGICEAEEYEKFSEMTSKITAAD